MVDAGGTRCRLSDPVPRETVNRWSNNDDDGARSGRRVGRASKRLLGGVIEKPTRKGCCESLSRGRDGRSGRERKLLAGRRSTEGEK